MHARLQLLVAAARLRVLIVLLVIIVVWLVRVRDANAARTAPGINDVAGVDFIQQIYRNSVSADIFKAICIDWRLAFVLGVAQLLVDVAPNVVIALVVAIFGGFLDLFGRRRSGR